ncbi:MAG: nucleotide exchange factor GrpE [Candidatus Woesearchaeota archaeon]
MSEKKIKKEKHQKQEINEKQEKYENSGKDEKKQLKDDKETQIEDLTNLLKRVQAEFSNYMKRTETEKKEIVKFASKEIILKLLPVIDNFDLALKNTNNNEEFVKGIEIVYNDLLNVLENEGLKKIEAKKFDPNFHEAIAIEESDEDGIVLEEIRKGYLINDKIVRHSLVKVSKKRSNEKNE